MVQKICSICKASKDNAEYGLDKYRADGLNTKCKACARVISKEKMRANRATAEGREKANASARRWLKRQRGDLEARKRINAEARVRHRRRIKDPAYLSAFRAKASAYNVRRRATPEGKKKMNLLRQKFDKNNPGKANAKVMRRKAAKLKACPPWANMEAIKKIYKDCPKGCHVDHIISLQGVTVCGLHIEDNLQYLPALDNCRKGNRMEEFNA